MKHRYIVVDDEGEPLRAFWSRAEAQAWLMPGYAIRRQKMPVKNGFAELLVELGEALI